MPPHPAVTPASLGLPEPQTTHVQVTSIVYVTAGVAAVEASQPTYLGQDSSLVFPSSVTHSSSRPPAPDATGVVYQLYEASAFDASSDEGTPNHGAILGGIIGGLAFLVLVLVIVAMRRNKSRYQKRSAAKKGSSRPTKHMATNDAINEAHRRRKERNRREHRRQIHNTPYGLTRADMAETIHQGNVMTAAQHAHGSYDDVEKAVSRPVAVVVPGSGRSQPVRSDRPDSMTLPGGDDFDEVDLSDYYLHDVRSSYCS